MEWAEPPTRRTTVGRKTFIEGSFRFDDHRHAAVYLINDWPEIQTAHQALKLALQADEQASRLELHALIQNMKQAFHDCMSGRRCVDFPEVNPMFQRHLLACCRSERDMDMLITAGLVGWTETPMLDHTHWSLVPQRGRQLPHLLDFRSTEDIRRVIARSPDQPLHRLICAHALRNDSRMTRALLVATGIQPSNVIVTAHDVADAVRTGCWTYADGYCISSNEPPLNYNGHPIPNPDHANDPVSGMVERLKSDGIPLIEFFKHARMSRELPSMPHLTTRRITRKMRYWLRVAEEQNG